MIVHADGEWVDVQYRRIGRTADKRDRRCKPHFDFVPVHNIQTEDDIGSSMPVPRHALTDLHAKTRAPALKGKKISECASRRPDDAIIRGCYAQCELDMAGKGNWMAKFEPQTGTEADAIRKDAGSLTSSRCGRMAVSKDRPVAHSRPCRDPVHSARS